MRNIEEQQFALNCLSLAVQHMDGFGDGNEALELAARFHAFVTGREEDDAKNKLDAVRGIVTREHSPS